MNAFSGSKLLLGLLELVIISNYVRFDLLLALNKLVLRLHVKSSELVQFDTVVTILITLFKQLVHDLRAVLLVNTLICKVSVHLFSVDFSVAIRVDCTELKTKLLLLRQSTASLSSVKILR